MSFLEKFSVVVTVPFEKQAKPLLKKYKSLKSELVSITDSLIYKPKQGIAIGNNCYKIRFSIKSKGKGKNGGGRIITYLKINQNTVYLVGIYDKSEKENLSDKELAALIAWIR